MVERLVPLRDVPALEAVERRYLFAAWPQACAHPSWLDMLDAAVALKLPRDGGHGVGWSGQALSGQAALVGQSVARALLRRAGADLSERIAVDRVPTWALQPHGPMRQCLSVVAALGALPALKLTVSGAETRRWDEALGPGVRQAALLLSQTDPEAAPPSQALDFLKAVSVASRNSGDWDRFCLGLGLAAVAGLGAAVCARIRLAWPCTFRNVKPLAVEQDLRPWLARACTKSDGLLGACRTWGVEREKRPQRGQFSPDWQAHSPAMGQKDGEKWTAAVDSQPTLPKSDGLLDTPLPGLAA